MMATTLVVMLHDLFQALLLCAATVTASASLHQLESCSESLAWVEYLHQDIQQPLSMLNELTAC